MRKLLLAEKSQFSILDMYAGEKKVSGFDVDSGLEHCALVMQEFEYRIRNKVPIAIDGNWESIF